MKQTDLPLVSIITPSYNQAEFLECTILSVLDQDYPNLEYILIDGGSTDGSLEIIQRYADRFKYWECCRDKGQTDAINKGFSHADGQIFAWINSDDTYQSGAIRKAVDFLLNHPHIGMVYGDCNFIDAHDRVIGQFDARQTTYRRMRRGFVHIPQQSAFWRAELWHKVAPLDDSIYFAMDYDLWLRLAKISQIQYYPDLWANFRLHGDTKTISEDDRGWKDMLKIHYRDGGGKISVITAKFLVRKLLSPLIRMKRRRMMDSASPGA